MVKKKNSQKSDGKEDFFHSRLKVMEPISSVNNLSVINEKTSKVSLFSVIIRNFAAYFRLKPAS